MYVTHSHTHEVTHSLTHSSLACLHFYGYVPLRKDIGPTYIHTYKQTNTKSHFGDVMIQFNSLAN